MSEMKSPVLTDAFNLFGKSWKIVQKNITIFAQVYSVPFILAIFGMLNQTQNNAMDSSRYRLFNSFDFVTGSRIPAAVVGFAVTFALLIGIVSIIFSLLQIVLVTKVGAGKKPTFSELWQVVSTKGISLFFLGIVVAVVIFLGLIVFIVPGLIFIRKYFYAPYVMIDQDKGISDSMKISSDLTKGRWGAVYGIIGVTILLNLPSIIPVVGQLITFFLMVAYSVAPALRYYELKAAH